MKSLLGASLALLLAQAEAPTLAVRTSSANVSIGESFQVTIETQGAPGTTYEFPREIAGGPVELHWSRSSAGQAGVAVYDAQAFSLGAEARVPAIEVRYKLADGTAGSLKTPEVPLNIVSSLDPNEKNPAPADLAPPVPVLVSRSFWVASGVAALLALAGLVALARRLRFPRKSADPLVSAPLSPEEEALSGLDALARSRATTEARATYIQLVQIVKLYLERRLQAPILEMTSTEALGFVKAYEWTAPDAPSLRDLVTAADLVKFGGSQDASSLDRHIQFARELVGRVDRSRRAEIEAQERALTARKTA